MYKLLDLQDLTSDEIMALFGAHDKNIEIINNFFNVNISLNDNSLYCDKDDNIEKIKYILNYILTSYRKGKQLNKIDINLLCENSQNDELKDNLFDHHLGYNFKHSSIYPKTNNQLKLVNTLIEKDMTFVVGPAGTGKTFLSVVFAINCLKKGIIEKIVITRPVVEAGESLGYLPGDLEEKINPYLRPIYDALDSIIGASNRINLVAKGVIEIAPLAYMRGRTLDNAVIILDEAQNTTKLQMQMFLTRMGFKSKVIINGDITQIDLGKNIESGLVDAINRFNDINEIGFITFTNHDVVRHPLVRKIIEKYAK